MIALKERPRAPRAPPHRNQVALAVEHIGLATIDPGNKVAVHSSPPGRLRRKTLTPSDPVVRAKLTTNAFIAPLLGTGPLVPVVKNPVQPERTPPQPPPAISCHALVSNVRFSLAPTFGLMTIKHRPRGPRAATAPREREESANMWGFSKRCREALGGEL
jgi:hypothetical protein